MRASCPAGALGFLATGFLPSGVRGFAPPPAAAASAARFAAALAAYFFCFFERTGAEPRSGSSCFTAAAVRE